eukprot:9146472-Heterocapsa_arctica.AAC.1
MYGPYSAPASWGFETVALPPSLAESEDLSRPLMPPPVLGAPAAIAFAIVTEADDGKEKIRSGEDWRRSCRNATAQ